MIEITFSIPLGALYFGLFVAGLLIGTLGARWVYRPAPGRVRVPYPLAGWQPSSRNACSTNPPPDHARPPAPPPKKP